MAEISQQKTGHGEKCKIFLMFADLVVFIDVKLEQIFQLPQIIIEGKHSALSFMHFFTSEIMCYSHNTKFVLLPLAATVMTSHLDDLVYTFIWCVSTSMNRQNLSSCKRYALQCALVSQIKWLNLDKERERYTDQARSGEKSDI